MKTCGECAWFNKGEGGCDAPVPLAMYDPSDRRSVDDEDDASRCPCFKARVCENPCQYCDGEGYVYLLLADRTVSKERTPCPKCGGKP